MLVVLIFVFLLVCLYAGMKQTANAEIADRQAWRNRSE
jgi:hypothetical protein